jgi:hypothetical protein
MKSAQVVLVAGVLLAVGCGKRNAEKSAAPPAQTAAGQLATPQTPEPAAPLGAPAPVVDSPVAEPVAEPVADPKPATRSAPAFARLPLEKAYKALWCGIKRRQRSGFDAIYAEAGVADADSFAASWKSEADADPTWASRVMAEAVNQGCGAAAR